MASSTIIGAAGEHYVMCQLLRRDLIAALAPTGVPNADIVVTDKVGDRLFAIQVKVRTDDGERDAWHMKAKHEEILSPSLFYSFVDFGGSLTAQPKCWVVPSKTVAKVRKLSHQNWLATPGPRGESTMTPKCGYSVDATRSRACHKSTAWVGWIVILKNGHC